MASQTNKIIGNIKQSTNRIDNFYESENVVCIDSSNIRIGIATKNPRYSIDVSGTNGTIYADNLLSNLAIIEEISNIRGVIHDLSIINILDICNICFINEISGNLIDVSFIRTNNIDINYINNDTIDSSFLKVITVSCNFLDVSDISVNTITLNNINFYNDKLIVHDISVNNDGYFNNIYVDNIYSNIIDSSFLQVSQEASFNRVDISFLKVSGDASFTNIDVSINAVFNDISVNNNAIFNHINSDNIVVNNLTAGGTNIVQDGQLSLSGNIILDNIQAGIIDISLNLNSRKISNFGNSNRKFTDNTLNISGGNLTLNNSGFLTFNNFAMLKLPSYNNIFNEPGKTITGYRDQVGLLAFDSNDKLLKIKKTSDTNDWETLNFDKGLATFKLNNDISGNDISINVNYTEQNPTLNKYFIENSNNLIIELNSRKYKYIPLMINTYSNKDLSNLNTLTEIFDTDISNIIIKNITNSTIASDKYKDLYEINCNLTVKYLNKIPNDVELNNYSFGIYPNIIDALNIDNIIDNNFINITNTIVVYDNSFNYSNISLSYIGPLGNSKSTADLGNGYSNGFKFLIYSDKDLDYLVIDNFYCTIKEA